MGRVEPIRRPSLSRALQEDLSAAIRTQQTIEVRKVEVQKKLADLRLQQHEVKARLSVARQRLTLAMRAFSGEGEGPMPTPAELEALPSLPDMQQAARDAFGEDYRLSEEIGRYEALSDETEQQLARGKASIIEAVNVMLRSELQLVLAKSAAAQDEVVRWRLAARSIVNYLYNCFAPKQAEDIEKAIAYLKLKKIPGYMDVDDFLWENHPVAQLWNDAIERKHVDPDATFPVIK
jgi:hypothetical protein